MNDSIANVLALAYGARQCPTGIATSSRCQSTKWLGTAYPMFVKPFPAAVSTPFFTRFGLVRMLIDELTTVCFSVASLPSVPSAATHDVTVPPGYGSLRMSSSRVHTILIGMPAAFDV